MEFSDKQTPKPDIVFITGGSGFIGSRIIKASCHLFLQLTTSARHQF